VFPALATPEALRAFMGTGALLATVDDFLADEILADEVLELIEDELDGINGKPLSKPARDAFWMRRLLYGVEPVLVFKHGDMLEKRFNAVAGLLSVPPAALAVELSNMGIKTSMVPPLLRALAPLRATAARAPQAAAEPAAAAPVAAPASPAAASRRRSARRRRTAGGTGHAASSRGRCGPQPGLRAAALRRKSSTSAAGPFPRTPAPRGAAHGLAAVLAGRGAWRRCGSRTDCCCTLLPYARSCT
jgi:hypothetical protein